MAVLAFMPRAGSDGTGNKDGQHRSLFHEAATDFIATTVSHLLRHGPDSFLCAIHSPL